MPTQDAAPPTQDTACALGARSREQEHAGLYLAVPQGLSYSLLFLLH